jgi:phage terminase large subunit-like protein
MQLPDWLECEARIDAAQIPDTPALIDRLPAAFISELSPLEALVLAHEPKAYLRARQLPPSDPDWLVLVYLCGRGWGKSLAAASWIVGRVLEGTPDVPSDYALIAPKLEDCWDLQWRAIKALVPPWIRCVERPSKQSVLFPDHGVTLFMHSAENINYRGPNCRGAWCEEMVVWPRGAELRRNLRLALRVKGDTPPRAVITTTPPRELNFILELCAEPTTRVVRGSMRDNPALDERAVEAAYKSMAGTIEGSRELDGRVVLGVDFALFKIEDLEAARVQVAPEHFDAVVVSCDPAQSNKRDADPVGITAIGKRGGHFYVLNSCSEKLTPEGWSTRVLAWCDRYNAGRIVVEPTGSGSYPRATLEAQMRIAETRRIPIVESKAIGSKADRAQPLSAAASAGRLHLVGRHEQLERELTQWFPGARFSPGGLDALVHGCSALTHNWEYL